MSIQIVRILELKKDARFVRVYDNQNSFNKGPWIMREKDIKGLSPAEIQNKYSLPFTPVYQCDVNLKAGTLLRSGITGPLFGYSGGGLQYDLMINGKNVGEFVNERLIK